MIKGCSNLLNISEVVMKRCQWKTRNGWSKNEWQFVVYERGFISIQLFIIQI